MSGRPGLELCQRWPSVLRPLIFANYAVHELTKALIDYQAD